MLLIQQRLLKVVLVVALITTSCFYKPQQANAFAWAGFLPAAFTVPVAGQALLAATAIGVGAYVGLKYGDTIVKKIRTDWTGIQAWYNNRTQIEKDNMAALAGSNVPATTTFNLNASAKNLIQQYLNGNTTYFIPKSAASIPTAKQATTANWNTCVNANGGGTAGSNACIPLFAPLTYTNISTGITFKIMPLETSPTNIKFYWFWWDGGNAKYQDIDTVSTSQGYTINPYSSTNGFRGGSIASDGTAPIGEPIVTVDGTTDTGQEYLRFKVNTTDGTNIWDYYIPAVLRIEAMLKMYGVNPVRESWLDVVIPGGLGKPIELDDEIKVPPGVVTGTSTSMTVSATEAQATTMGQTITTDTTIEEPPPSGGSGNTPPSTPMGKWNPFTWLKFLIDWFVWLIVFIGYLIGELITRLTDLNEMTSGFRDMLKAFFETIPTEMLMLFTMGLILAILTGVLRRKN